MQRFQPRFPVLIFRPLLRLALLPLAAGSLLSSCAPTQTEPTPSAGPLDVSRYLAVGDGYTAGFSDGGLTAASQEYSYPALLARQFARINPQAAFTQGLLPAGTGTGYLTLRELNALGIPQTSRVTKGRAVRSAYFVNPTACGGPDTTFLYAQAPSAPLSQNLGVPGLGLTQVGVAGLGNTANQNKTGAFNPYLERLLPLNDNRTYLQTVTDASANASFFTFFMGLGDALPYMLNGGECGAAPSGSLLNLNAKKVLDQLTANGRPGVIALVPSLQNLPFLRLGGKDGIRGQLTQGANPDSIYITSSIGNVVRPIDAGDFVLPAGLARLGRQETVALPGGGTVQARYGLSRRNPVSRRDVLDLNEFSRVNSSLIGLNTELERLATKVYKLPFVKLEDELFFQINTRISVNGVEYSAAPVRGNFYSLDLYSLTPRGNALLANAFLKTINKSYRANIPYVDANTLPTTARPQ
ncbi:hypothetical protein [Hymenobacter rubripertinctus]|uniref:SGNH/GDSL hydrolase family protein n=1 Tax=Hymenobacter rubripertinctus TaxID=2029981 RepID=A0A418R441_9BACT|nr:hypothetical protein [Hymenobacter rubripertinctus]RIY12213.1 hypothetical protein D0T11_06135 [Hymenobacter rubripertinctus]